MGSIFTYSILQYKHSIIVREVINVGVLFYFPADEKIIFVSGNSTRVKAIYPDFDQNIFNYLVKDFNRKITNVNVGDLYNTFKSTNDIKSFINTHLLNEDSTSLQFTDSIKAVNTFPSYELAADFYSRLLLPGIDIKKSDVIKHDENFIIKTFNNYLIQKDKNIDNRIGRNREIQVGGMKLKFDIAWQNGTTNLVRPISFDLTKRQDIQNKYTQFYGYLTLFEKYARLNKIRFDFLVAKPQDESLYNDYKTGIDILEKSTAPKRIIKENELKAYSEETVEYLLKEQSN